MTGSADPIVFAGLESPAKTPTRSASDPYHLKEAQRAGLVN